MQSRVEAWVQYESERLGSEYRRALQRYWDSVAFWKANPIAYSVDIGEAVPVTTLNVVLEADRMGTPDQRCREAMTILDQWREFRAANGLP